MDYYTNLLISGIEFKRGNFVAFLFIFSTCLPKLPLGTYKLIPWKIIKKNFKFFLLGSSCLGEIVAVIFILINWDFDTATFLHYYSIVSGLGSFLSSILNLTEESLSQKFDSDVGHY